ncbi:H-type small acid-soluble spore protein [Cohnella lubricantis]|uniref:H-type small acid-soluble spore protein n=1 Tax=Cohnella lubricantis TaxID=2163172 RepID=A0A841TE99_9BACL|nr:H-type small acid-soluble spore protein [Cohnella lubricantis]MBB6679753.1 H-type small acid-soluble spore protein [Cohnella lubricantis]MBP2119455.1 small acid-soluble spore protein H (minor) [Cohnella lubricantis]
MNAERAQQIYESSDTIAVQLDGDPVWIEKVDAANGVATVKVGSNPLNTQTVAVERLQEH